MEKTTIGTVTLNVADIERQLDYYQQVIGLRLIERQKDLAYLGVDGGIPLLALKNKPDGKRYGRTTGLYHFAILVPSRYHLALVFNHLVQNRIRLQGASDHIVSEALYLEDPEGNGIEIYRDRPKEDWQVNGNFQMSTLPLQIDEVMGELTGMPIKWGGLDGGTIMGHIHLHVASIPEVRNFYTGLLGMDEMISMPSATFLSYDGYHHHIGANTWSGNMPPPDDALGLEKFTLYVTPERSEEIRQRLEQGGVAFKQTENGHMVDDPSKNSIEIVSV